MTEKQHHFYKYLFIFGNGDKKIVLFGKEIANFWNDIYDLFHIERRMVVQKLNGTNFTEKEIRALFWDLYEDMDDDGVIISLYVSSLSKLDFSHTGDIYELPEVSEQLDKLDDDQFEIFAPSIDKMRKGLCEMNLNWAIEEIYEKEMKYLVKGFKIKKTWELNRKENLKLKQYLVYFQRAKESPDNWAINLRHILDNNPDKKGDLKKVYELVCNSSIKNSAHEGKGINLGKKLEEYSSEQIKFCEKSIKQYIQSLINKSGFNNKK